MRRFGGRDPARTDLKDDLRPLAGDVLGFPDHMRLLSKRRVVVPLLLDLEQPAAKAVLRSTAATLHDLAQPRTEHRSVLQTHLVLQSPQHALHRPVLPVLEGYIIDLHLTADLRLADLLGPCRQHRLSLLLGAEGLGRPAGLARRASASRRGGAVFLTGFRTLRPGGFRFGCHIRVLGWRFAPRHRRGA